jgi:hypothetical protein
MSILKIISPASVVSVAYLAQKSIRIPLSSVVISKGHFEFANARVPLQQDKVETNQLNILNSSELNEKEKIIELLGDESHQALKTSTESENIIYSEKEKAKNVNFKIRQGEVLKSYKKISNIEFSRLIKKKTNIDSMDDDEDEESKKEESNIFMNSGTLLNHRQF